MTWSQEWNERLLGELQITFRFARHSHVSPIYTEARVRDPSKQLDGSQIYGMSVTREVEEILIHHRNPPIDIPSPPLQTPELRAASFSCKRRSMKPLLDGVGRTTPIGPEDSPLLRVFCPVCNRASMKVAKGSTRNEVEVDCNACRASFTLTRTDGGQWSSITFKPNKIIIIILFAIISNGVAACTYFVVESLPV